MGVVAAPPPPTRLTTNRIVYSTICPAELEVAIFNDVLSEPLLAAQGPAVSSKVLTCPRPNLFSRNFCNSDRKTSQPPGRPQIQTERK